MSLSITERVRRLRKDTLEIARDSLDHNIRVYRGLSDVAVQLTDVIKQSDITEASAAVIQPVSIPPETSPPTEPRGDEYESEAVDPPTPASERISISARYGGVTHKALLDTSRISDGGRGKCVWLRGEWMTASGAAGNITRSQVNGWQNFWRYKRNDGSEGSIAEIRDQQVQSGQENDVPW